MSVSANKPRVLITICLLIGLITVHATFRLADVSIEALSHLTAAGAACSYY